MKKLLYFLKKISFILVILTPIEKTMSQDIEHLIAYTNEICKHFNAEFRLLHVIDKDTKKEKIKEIRNNTNKKLSGTNGNLLLEFSEDPIGHEAKFKKL